MADVWANSMACHPRATYIIITLQGAAPLGEFTVTIQEPHAILQSVRISSAILKIVFLPYFIFYLYFIYFFVFNAVYALTSGGFRIVSDTLVWRVSVLITIFYLDRDLSFFLCILWKPSRTIERRVVCDTLGDITSSVVQNVDHTTSECNDPKQATGELFEWKASNERDTSRTHVDHRWLSRPKAFVRRHDWPEVTASEKLLQFIQRNFLERLGA